MRIKINDKIYRLKEIESGVDSLMELVEEPRYKDGDFVVNDLNAILIFKEAYGDLVSDHAYLSVYGELVIDKFVGCKGVKRHATTEEKQRMTKALAERGKRWNADKKCVEDIPKRKFKAGDKVRIKDGISSDTHGNTEPHFTSMMDKFIGKELTVKEYRDGFVFFNEDYPEYQFAEDWLEPCSDEPKVGDLAIFWDYSKDIAIMRTYREKKGMLHYDSAGYPWKNSIKFESKEQFEKVLRGEI